VVVGMLAVPFALGLSQSESRDAPFDSDARSERATPTAVPTHSQLDVSPVAGPTGDGTPEPDPPLEHPIDRPSRDERVVSIAPVLVAEPRAAEVETSPRPRRPPPARAQHRKDSQTTASFDYGAALQALEQAPRASASCGADVAGPARVSATFAPSGKATRVLVLSDPLKGTEAGSCVARTLRDITVPPYASGFITVTDTIALR
jgi:hypothetical protein